MQCRSQDFPALVENSDGSLGVKQTLRDFCLSLSDGEVGVEPHGKGRGLAEASSGPKFCYAM